MLKRDVEIENQRKKMEIRKITNKETHQSVLEVPEKIPWQQSVTKDCGLKKGLLENVTVLLLFIIKLPL